MDNLGNMKSLENCQIVCNNAALATGPQPGLQFPSRGRRRLAWRNESSEGAGWENFVHRGPLQILRQQESAVGCLFWLVTFTPCLSARHFAFRPFEKADTYAILLSDPSNLSLSLSHSFYLAVSFRNHRVVAVSSTSKLSRPPPSLLPFFLYSLIRGQESICFRVTRLSDPVGKFGNQARTRIRMHESGRIIYDSVNAWFWKLSIERIHKRDP